MAPKPSTGDTMREINRRRTLLAGVALTMLGSVAHAQVFPNKPIRLICPFPPAGAVDIASRAIANELSKNLGQPVTVMSCPKTWANR